MKRSAILVLIFAILGFTAYKFVITPVKSNLVASRVELATNYDHLEHLYDDFRYQVGKQVDLQIELEKSSGGKALLLKEEYDQAVMEVSKSSKELSKAKSELRDLMDKAGEQSAIGKISKALAYLQRMDEWLSNTKQPKPEKPS